MAREVKDENCIFGQICLVSSIRNSISLERFSNWYQLTLMRIILISSPLSVDTNKQASKQTNIRRVEEDKFPH